MNKISCDICMDLMPLVKDEVASEDSKQAVYEHINSCPACRELYGEEVDFETYDDTILHKFKKKLTYLYLTIIILGILLGISISSNQFMFYNVLIMPAIGGISYFSFKWKCFYVHIAVFVTVYLRFFYETFGYVFHGDFLAGFISPLSWAIIYLALTLLGTLVAFLLNFGFKKEN